jgi:hypothetical protein
MKLTYWMIGALVGALTFSGEALAGAHHHELDTLARQMISGGPPPDGIPSIDRPKFVPAARADAFLDDEDIVFGVRIGSDVRAYPRKVLVWHEIVNDTVGGRPVALTYCPLTGSAIAFLRELDGKPVEFGTSGKLVNSNLVMYDRATKSEWPQILGRAVQGPRKGARLASVPVAWTTWGQWRSAHPETQVLSTRTGFLRAYGKDPYGSYDDPGSYYHKGGAMFPLLSRGDDFRPKEVVIGIDDGSEALAIPKTALRKQGLITTKLGGDPVVVLYDPSVDDARAWRTGGRSFSVHEGAIVDERGARWDSFGRSDRGEQLEFVHSFDLMWFAWKGFFPTSRVEVGERAG